MNVVNQDFNDRLAVLKVCFPRTDGIAKHALDDRVHGFGFPALSEETIQTGGGDHIGSGFSLRINRFAMSSNRRNDVRRTPILGVKARIRRHQPSASLGFALRAKVGHPRFKAFQQDRSLLGPSPDCQESMD